MQVPRSTAGLGSKSKKGNNACKIGHTSLVGSFLTQLSFQNDRLLFSHVSAEVKGENMPERKFASTVGQTQSTRS